jgi:hypothetical protein
MHGTTVRRWATGTAALTLALATAACGAEDGSAAPAHATATARHAAAKPKASPETGPVLTQHQLEAAVIDKGDLPGLWIEGIGGSADGTADPGNGLARPVAADLTDPAACAPVDGASYGAGRHTPVGSVRRTAEAGKGPAILALVSYRHGDATRTLDDLRTALEHCTAFHEKDVKDTRFTDIRPVDTAPVCDDTVSFRYTKVLTGSDGKDMKIPARLTAFRCGSTVAAILAMTVGGGTASPEIPEDLLHAQAKALKKAVDAS